MITKAVLILTMEICSSSRATLRDRIAQMEKQGWTQRGQIVFAPCEGWNTAKNGIYEEGECATMTKTERIKSEKGRDK